MIEQNLFPASFGVATFTLRTEIALVLIILFMTRVAVHWQLFFYDITFVTTAAARGQMLAQQGILGFFGMIEQDFLPALLNVAGLAFLPEVAFMFIVFLVAGYTACL